MGDNCDDTNVYDEERFDELHEEIRRLLEMCGEFENLLKCYAPAYVEDIEAKRRVLAKWAQMKEDRDGSGAP